VSQVASPVKLGEEKLAWVAFTYLAEPGDPALGALLGICEPAEVLAAIKADMLPGTGPGCGDSPASRATLERATWWAWRPRTWRPGSWASRGCLAVRRRFAGSRRPRWIEPPGTDIPGVFSTSAMHLLGFPQPPGHALRAGPGYGDRRSRR